MKTIKITDYMKVKIFNNINPVLCPKTVNLEDADIYRILRHPTCPKHMYCVHPDTLELAELNLDNYSKTIDELFTKKAIKEEVVSEVITDVKPVVGVVTDIPTIDGKNEIDEDVAEVIPVVDVVTKVPVKEPISEAKATVITEETKASYNQQQHHRPNNKNYKNYNNKQQ